jgi:hypothetical protein
MKGWIQATYTVGPGDVLELCLGKCGGGDVGGILYVDLHDQSYGMRVVVTESKRKV